MSFVTAAVGLVGAGVQAYGAHKAAGAQEDAANRAAGTTASQNRLIQQQQAPYRQIGLAATNQLAQLYGLPGAQEETRQVGSGTFKPTDIGRLIQSGMSVDEILQQGILGPGQGPKELKYLQGLGLSPDDISRLENGTFTPMGPPGGGADGQGGAPDYSAFYNSPDYKFALDQGEQSVQRAAAAGGKLASGNTLAAASQYGQGLATQNYQNYLSGLRGLAGQGQQANDQSNQYSYNTGQSIADTQVGAGAARASGVAGQYNALGDAIGIGGNALAGWLKNRRGSMPVNAQPVSPGGYSAPLLY